MNVQNDVFLLLGKIISFLLKFKKKKLYLIYSELRPVIVEPWDIRDEEDGLPEKSLIRNPAYVK
jgi:hypothetical protein